ncbi:hypothetical protein BABINDRAFT_162839 [Babjeviella inositovora NRRL Y-12698]|uniref:Uncharacterized protein n=1 Tax=Babjeviella inositovora NRRL Y-12698 TaxID=984486 RepID=A0A1E3QMF8_9ASCO|nr:uncharacterized protein BABINDRAFT_162839 [Babjeviella inositovora NRRL Y-12698]ODQ78167.1 hypothetical protein BABINDRAFT_162839 [Babjeviella inositovora NRRL Y-12698]
MIYEPHRKDRPRITSNLNTRGHRLDLLNSINEAIEYEDMTNGHQSTNSSIREDDESVVQSTGISARVLSRPKVATRLLLGEPLPLTYQVLPSESIATPVELGSPDFTHNPEHYLYHHTSPHPVKTETPEREARDEEFETDDSMERMIRAAKHDKRIERRRNRNILGSSKLPTRDILFPEFTAPPTDLIDESLPNPVEESTPLDKNKTRNLISKYLEYKRAIALKNQKQNQSFQKPKTEITRPPRDESPSPSPKLLDARSRTNFSAESAIPSSNQKSSASGRQTSSWKHVHGSENMPSVIPEGSAHGSPYQRPHTTQTRGRNFPPHVDENRHPGSDAKATENSPRKKRVLIGWLQSQLAAMDKNPDPVKDELSGLLQSLLGETFSGEEQVFSATLGDTVVFNERPPEKTQESEIPRSTAASDDVLSEALLMIQEKKLNKKLESLKRAIMEETQVASTREVPNRQPFNGVPWGIQAISRCFIRICDLKIAITFLLFAMVFLMVSCCLANLNLFYCYFAC